MKNMYKRLLSLTLALCMVMVWLPAQPLAVAASEVTTAASTTATGSKAICFDFDDATDLQSLLDAGWAAIYGGGTNVKKVFSITEEDGN